MLPKKLMSNSRWRQQSGGGPSVIILSDAFDRRTAMRYELNRQGFRPASAQIQHAFII
jgi:hypothetical protein